MSLEDLPNAVYSPHRTGLHERLESLQYDRRIGPMVAAYPETAETRRSRRTVRRIHADARK